MLGQKLLGVKKCLAQQFQGVTKMIGQTGTSTEPPMCHSKGNKCGGFSA